jgi:hypothetical protein
LGDAFASVLGNAFASVLGDAFTSVLGGAFASVLYDRHNGSGKQQTMKPVYLRYFIVPLRFLCHLPLQLIPLLKKGVDEDEVFGRGI